MVIIKMVASDHRRYILFVRYIGMVMGGWWRMAFWVCVFAWHGVVDHVDEG